MKATKKTSRLRRHARVRSKISGTSSVPRVSVFRSNAHMYVQVIDDKSQKTILGMSDKALKGTKSERSKELGKLVAQSIIKSGIKKALFDRGGYKYHGRVQNVAVGLREGGLAI
jgi:large subunit ribosomal protein L18